MKKKSLPLSEVYRFLEPGPVVMISTARKGRPNVMPMTWQTMMDFEPPIVGLIISNRNYTYNILKQTRECVINIPTAQLAKKVVACGDCDGNEVDKFKQFHLTALPASKVKAPLVGECFANFECKLIETWEKYELFVVKVVKAWVTPSKKRPRTIHHQGRGVFAVDGRTFKLPFRWK
jgi:flavin reductase (DIM6/NTAB) family NADH-FMN oxidoreductase RutF